MSSVSAPGLQDSLRAGSALAQEPLHMDQRREYLDGVGRISRTDRERSAGAAVTNKKPRTAFCPINQPAADRGRDGVLSHIFQHPERAVQQTLL